MKLKDLIKHLQDWEQDGKGDADVDVLIETPESSIVKRVQFQYPLNRVAYSSKTNTIIIMHEEW